MTANIKLVGILNLTPDSFSDGGKYNNQEQAVAHARRLISEGADWVELGGDSTRSGSICVGPQEEWKRVEPVLQALSGQCALALDTHHAQVARQALTYGVSIINDVSAGSDPQMFEVLAASSAKLVLMYSRCITPHVFGPEASGDIITCIIEFWSAKRALAFQAGIKPEQLIFDTGMGAFLSAKPDRSLELLQRFSELQVFEHPLMLAISRKGFTKEAQETSIDQRDHRSLQLTLDVLQKANLGCPVYLRVHNVALHKAAIARTFALNRASPSDQV